MQYCIPVCSCNEQRRRPRRDARKVSCNTDLRARTPLIWIDKLEVWEDVVTAEPAALHPREAANGQHCKHSAGNKNEVMHGFVYDSIIHTAIIASAERDRGTAACVEANG